MKLKLRRDIFPLWTSPLISGFTGFIHLRIPCWLASVAAKVSLAMYGAEFLCFLGYLDFPC